MKIYFNSYVFILPSNLNTFFINSLSNSRNLWHYQWPAEFIKQMKPASKWHQIALYERWMWLFFCLFFVCFCFCFCLFLFFGGWGGVWTTVLFWNPWYYYWDIVKENDHHIWMSKIGYLGITGVTKKLHQSIAKLNYELNDSKKRCEG